MTLGHILLTVLIVLTLGASIGWMLPQSGIVRRILVTVVLAALTFFMVVVGATLVGTLMNFQVAGWLVGRSFLVLLFTLIVWSCYSGTLNPPRRGN